MKPKSPVGDRGGEKTAATVIRSHSIPGDLHGIHAPDPVAADILRKEPEQETFVRLNVTPLGAAFCSENRNKYGRMLDMIYVGSKVLELHGQSETLPSCRIWKGLFS